LSDFKLSNIVVFMAVLGTAPMIMKSVGALDA